MGGGPESKAGVSQPAAVHTSTIHATAHYVHTAASVCTLCAHYAHTTTSICTLGHTTTDICTFCAHNY